MYIICQKFQQPCRYVPNTNMYLIVHHDYHYLYLNITSQRYLNYSAICPSES